MFISIASRFLRLFITSVIISMVFFLLRFIKVEIPDSGILFFAFVAFNVIVGFDAFMFSITFWKKEDYFIGQLLPCIIFLLLAIMVYMLSVPGLLNAFFLPLRFFECFYIKTIFSMLISGGILLLIITILRIAGVYTGKREHQIYVMENTEM